MAGTRVATLKSQAPSSAPSRGPPTSFKRDGSIIPSSVPSSIYSRGSPTAFKRDGTVIPAMATSSTSSRAPSRIPSTAPSQLHSIHVGSKAQTMASRQASFATLTPVDQKEQSKWAQSVISQQNACPEGYSWDRVDGGYQCKGRGHGMSDNLIAEGKCGVLSLPTRRWGEFNSIYYPEYDGAPSGKYRKAIGSEKVVHLHAPGAQYIEDPNKPGK